MEYIICCLNIKESYERITNHFKSHPYIGFEEFTCDIDEVKNKSLYKKWKYAVVDKKLSWFGEAVKFFKKNKIEIIYFDDDYSDVISSIKNKVQKPAEDDIGRSQKRPFKGTGVRYIEKPITKVVEKKIYTSLEKKLILVSGLSKSAGATTITLNLAKYLSNLDILSSVIEPPIDPTIFNWIGIEEIIDKSVKHSDDGFYSYPHEIAGGRRIKNKAEFILTILYGLFQMIEKRKLENGNTVKCLS